MKKKTLRREVNFKPPKEQTESTRPHRYAEPGFYRLCSERDHHDQIPADPRGKFPEDVLKKDGSASLMAGNTMGPQKWHASSNWCDCAKLAPIFLIAFLAAFLCLAR